ncbi:MAG TPA: shikimate dehydrogenase, partial [Candidatus Eisenbacteria bacterium]
MAPHPAGLTRLYAVLGHPVNHSLSPTMQSAAFRAAEIDAAYVALDVPPERLAEVLRELHRTGFSGLNLTAPHKEAAWALVQSATDEAKRSRAVNTLRREESGWAGHATDGPGFAAWIASLGLALRGARVLLLGAGGAARSIAPVLASLEPAAIRVVSRDGGRARAVAEELRRSGGTPTDVTAAALGETTEKGLRWDLLVRAFSSSSVDALEASWWE